jgi:hypothetical protein
MPRRIGQTLTADNGPQAASGARMRAVRALPQIEAQLQNEHAYPDFLAHTVLLATVPH